MKIVYTLLTALIVLYAISENAFAAEKEVQASFCNLSLSEHTKHSNITFTNRYFFRIDGQGKPIKIDRISGYDYVNDDEIRSCVNEWKFKDFAENTSFTIEIRWVHGEGWRPMIIRSKGYSIIVKQHKRN